MWTMVRLRIRLAVPVGGPFVTAVRCMAVSGYALGVRAVNGDGEMFWLGFRRMGVFEGVGLDLGTSEAFSGRVWFSMRCIRAFVVVGDLCKTTYIHKPQILLSTARTRHDVCNKSLGTQMDLANATAVDVTSSL
jgi:hypothetical protein